MITRAGKTARNSVPRELNCINRAISARAARIFLTAISRILFAVAMLAGASPAHAEVLTGTYPVNPGPFAVAVNPVTNRVYIAHNRTTAYVTVMDGATQSIITSIPAGSGANAVAVNPATNKIYVTRNDGQVTIIDGATNSATVVTAGTSPVAVAVNEVTNKIYVVNGGGSPSYNGSVTVIDGVTLGTTNVPITYLATGVAVNPVTNKIYVSSLNTLSPYNGSLTVIDGITNGTTPVAAGRYSNGVAVNPVTNKIYVINRDDNNVTIVNGSTLATSTAAVGQRPSALLVNPVTNKIHVACEGAPNGSVWSIDGTTEAATQYTLPSVNFNALALNPVSNRLYLLNGGATPIYYLDAGTGSWSFISSALGYPNALAVNPVTGRVFIANTNNDAVQVLDGFMNRDGFAAGTATVTVGNDPRGVAVNPATNKIYVSNFSGKTVSVIDGATNGVTSVALSGAFDYPFAITVNPLTNRIYTANHSSGSVSVINGATASIVATIPGMSTPWALAANPVTNRIYVANFGGGIAVIDGQSNTLMLTTPSYISPYAVAVNPVTNKIYVANYGDGASPGAVTVLDGATNNIVNVTTGVSSSDVAVNPVTNKIYVANKSDNTVTVMDGVTNVTTPVSVCTNPWRIAVNSLLNRIYVACTSGNLSVMDGVTNAVTNVASGANSQAIVLNPASNRIYVANIGASTATAIDGITNTPVTVNTGSTLYAVAVNPITGKAYVAGGGASGVVTVISERAVQNIPLVTTIASFGGDTTTASIANFSFTATSGYSPTAPPVQKVWYQLDTLQGAWQGATFSAGAWRGSSTTLSYGVHTVYAFAVDGQEATTIDAGSSTSSIPGQLAAYHFMRGVPAPLAITTASLPDGEVAYPYATQTLTGSGGSGQGYSWSALSGLPAGLSLTSGGVLSGTPTSSVAASLNIQLTDDANNTVTRLFNFTLYPALAISTASLPNGNTGVAYSRMLATTGGSGGNVWTPVSGFPAWLTLTSGGALSGTPSVTGAVSITVRVTDSLGQNVTQVYGFTIYPPLSITTASLPNSEVTLAYNQTLAASGGSGSGFSWTVLSGLPTGLALSAAGVLSGSPTAAGPASLNVQVTDSAANTATRLFNFTIYPAVAITTASLPNGEVNLAYGQSINASGGSGGNVWSVVFGLPPPLSLSSAGVLSGTPTAAGSVNLGVRVTDSLGGTASQTYSFSIFSALTVTTASLTNGSVGISYSRTLSASGGSGGNQWTITSGLTPSGIAFSPTGTLSGTPQSAGTSSFTVQVQDSLGAVASRPLSLTIIQPLAIVNSNLTDGVFSEPYPFTVLQAAGGVTPYLFSIIGGSLPPGLGMNPSGQITGLPTQVGSFPVTFRVTDFNNSIANRAYTLVVVDPPAEPNWTPRGQFGGKIQDVRVSPDYANDQNLLVMSETGELFRSGDKGGSWSRALVNANRAYNYNNRFRLSPVFSAAPAATSDDQKTVFFASFDIGVWKSIDRAATFTPANNGIPCAGIPCTPGIYPQIIGLAISPNYAADHTLWAADYDNKIYRTTDGGANWSLLATLPPAVGGLNTPITPSPSFAQDQTLFLSVGNLIFKSLNAGSSWSQIYAVLDGLGQPLGVKNLVISPAYAVDHTLIVEAENFHLFRTKNSGTNFNDISLPGAAYGHHLTVVPRAGLSPLWYMESSSSGNYVYRLLYSEDTGTTFARLYAFGMSSGNDASNALGLSPWLGSNVDLYYGTDLGLYASFDGGFNFSERDQGLNANVVHSVAGKGDVVAAAYKGGWFKSADKAANRVRLDAPQSAIDVKEVFLSAVSPDYANDNIIFLGDSQSVLRSADGGQSFAEVLSAPGNDTKIAFLPAFSGNGPVRTMYLGNAGGLYQSTDGGQSFTAIPLPAPLCSSVANPAIQGIVISPNYATDQTIFVASAISGTEGGLCKSANGGAGWTRVTNGGTLISGPIAISPSYNEAAGPGPDKTLMIYQLRSVNGGATWTQSSGPANLNGVSILAPNFAANQTAFMYGDGIFRSTDFGATFSALGAGNALQSRNVTGLYIPPDFNPVTGEIAASTNGSGVWRSVDGGRTFQPTVGSTSIPGTINGIIRVPGGSGLAGPGAIRNRTPETPETVNLGSILVATAEQGIFQSDDGGVTFTNISAGLPANANTRALTVPSGSVSTPVTAVAGRGLWKYNGASWDQLSGLAAGTYTSFAEDNLYLYATRADGVSQRADKSGTTWSPQDPGKNDLVSIHYNPATGPTTLNLPVVSQFGPQLPAIPAAVTASLWSVSQSGGPHYSLNSGANWLAAPGGGDNQLPAGLTYKTIQALGINSASGGREVLAGAATGLYRSTDGGAGWRNVAGPGSGLQGTSRNFSTTLTTLTPSGTTDILVGAIGSTDGGVYLSGDGGEHWMQINEGFNPTNLNISTLVRTSCSGCPVQYYSGTYGSGVYTRTIPVNTAPAITGWCTGAGCVCATGAVGGPQAGGQPFKACGTGFLPLALVAFDAADSPPCTVTGTTELACVTPPHLAGTVNFRVRNSDTRRSTVASAAYTYAAGASRVGNTLIVAKSGQNAALSWNCASCTGAAFQIFRSGNAAFSLNLEHFTGDLSTTFNDPYALAPWMSPSFFWTVE